jgi:type VI secretion system protein ImpG
MSESLYPYYDRELVFFRQLAGEFAKQYPAAAGRLLLEQGRSVDPHVERLIEAFALLSGRIHHKLDDEFPELTDALLGVLYPHYLAPVPSMSVVQFDLNPAQAQLPEGFSIPRHSKLKTRVAVDGVRAEYRTGYPVTLWPVRLTEAQLTPPPFPQGWRPPPRTAAALRLRLDCPGELPFSALALDRLRFFLHGDNAVIGGLYELIFNHALQVVYRPLERATKTQPLVCPPQGLILPVGFEPDEGLLPYGRQSFPGYRLLTEFFAFPTKFLFLDLAGFDKVREAGFQKMMEVVIYLDRSQASLEAAVEATTFRLGCTPVVNLFEQTAEPRPVTQTRPEYLVVPDVAAPLGLEVYSVDSVSSVDPTKGAAVEYQPFYSFRHGGGRDADRAFWYAERRPATGENDHGTNVYLHLVDLDFDPREPAEGTLVIRTTCTNRDVPTKLQQAGDDLQLELELAAPLERVGCLRAPTATLRPSPNRRGVYWKLISHLSLNHLSLTDPVEGRAALQEILRLYDFSDQRSGRQLHAVNEQIIDGITALSSRPVVDRVGGPVAGGFARGVEVTAEFDEQKYVGAALYLFACVLERFLGLYVSVNSFCRFVATTRQGQGVLKRWPPRAGEQPLL